PAPAAVDRRRVRGTRGLRLRPHRARRPEPADGVAPPEGAHRSGLPHPQQAGDMGVLRSRSRRARPHLTAARLVVSGAGVRALGAEFLGSALLAAIVVGSGIAASSLSPGDVGLQLFENAFATALGLAVLIVIF